MGMEMEAGNAAVTKRVKKNERPLLTILPAR